MSQLASPAYCVVRGERQGFLSLALSFAREAKAATVLTEMQGNTAYRFLDWEINKILCFAFQLARPGSQYYSMQNTNLQIRLLYYLVKCNDIYDVGDTICDASVVLRSAFGGVRVRSSANLVLLPLSSSLSLLSS